MSDALLPGAAPWSHDGGRNGALCIHGFTGNPSSMRPVADALAAAGFSIELPRLPGHGTTVAEMMTTSWADWSGEVEAAYQRLAARCDKVLVTGLSMGGSLSLWLAARHPELVGVACINPAAMYQPELAELVEGMIASGETIFPGIGSDIAKEGVVESAYPDTPLAPLLSLSNALADLQDGLKTSEQPLLLLSSPQDHVVVPEQADHLAAVWGGPVKRIILERSFHVATLDHDAELVQRSIVAFAHERFAS